MSHELPDGWEWATLGEVAEVAGGIQKSPKRRPSKRPLPMLRVANVGFGTLDLGEVHEIEVFDGEEERYELQVGDILVVEGNGSLSQIGRAAMWSGEIPRCVHQNHLLRVRTTDLHPRFLELYLHCPMARSELEKVASSTSGLHVLSGAKLKRLPVVVPPTNEQVEIVSVVEEHLSRLDSAEESVASARRRLDALRRTAVVSLFDRPDWPWTTLGEIAEVKGGVTKDSKRQNDPDFVEMPYLRVANVQRGFLDLTDVATIRVAPKKAEQLRLIPGDVLFTEGGDRDKLGRGWVWEGRIGYCIHQNHVFRARLSADAFDPYFVSMHGNTWGQQWFERHGKQTTNLASINLTTLRAFPVPAPPLSEQRELVAELDVLLRGYERLCAEVDRADAHAALLRRSILSAAFTGRLMGTELELPPTPGTATRVDHELERRPA